MPKKLIHKCAGGCGRDVAWPARKCAICKRNRRRAGRRSCSGRAQWSTSRVLAYSSPLPANTAAFPVAESETPLVESVFEREV